MSTTLKRAGASSRSPANVASPARIVSRGKPRAHAAAELPVAARLDGFGLYRDIDRKPDRIRCVDANAHERGDGISSHAKLPSIRTNSTTSRPGS